MKEILQGLVDLHVHAGPSVAKREVDAAEMLSEAVQAGYRAFVVKDHYFPTVMSASLVEKHLGKEKIRVFGGIALNNSVGGINLKAVDAACDMGAKFVYMPTVSAHRHIESHKGRHFVGAGQSKVEEKPLFYLDEQGELLPEVVELIHYVAQKPGLILATGHGTVAEVDALVHKAAETGVQKIYVNHPFFTVGAGIEEMIRWAKLGAYIEINACVFPPFPKGPVSLEVISEILGNIPLDQVVISSDFGQAGFGSPVERMYNFLMNLMQELNVSEDQINRMTKITPAKLLDLE